MEQREPSVDSHAQGAEGRLRELASKWFIETQMPLMVHNGLFPTWFLGFITRKDAEEMLREKELGCFLIRLSDKAIGYILSYKGRDRCRHFVINQSESGQFVVCGDTTEHDTVSHLLEYYKTSPIQPFREYLTSSCFQVLNEELYDIIQVSPKEKPTAAVRAVDDMQNHQINFASEYPPKRPPKGSRTQEEGPPLPRRSRHLDNGPQNDQDGVFYTQIKKQSPREIPRSQHTCQDSSAGSHPGRAERSATQEQHARRCSPPSGSDYAHPDLGLLESKSRSLPLLDNSCDGEQSCRLGAPPYMPRRLSPKAARQAACHGPLLETAESSSRAGSSHSLERTSDDAVYHLAGRPGSPHSAVSDLRSSTPEQDSDSVYAVIHGEAPAGRFSHANTYQLIPGHKDQAKAKANSNTYEPLEDIRSKVNHSSWGLKTDKWKWLFPEVKRKW